MRCSEWLEKQRRLPKQYLRFSNKAGVTRNLMLTLDTYRKVGKVPKVRYLKFKSGKRSRVFQLGSALSCLAMELAKPVEPVYLP